MLQLRRHTLVDDLSELLGVDRLCEGAKPDETLLYFLVVVDKSGNDRDCFAEPSSPIEDQTDGAASDFLWS